MNNHYYNLMNQLVQEQKSLWRIERLYLDEAQTAEETALWERIRDDKKVHVAELKAMVKQYLD